MDTRGIYRKFKVERTDGDPERKHTECIYFVLDLVHDENAIPALKAYAKSCAKKRPQLAKDIRWALSLEIGKKGKYFTTSAAQGVRIKMDRGATRFAELKGKTLLRVEGLEVGSESVKFVCSDGEEFTMYHSRDCCESVSVEDVCGEVSDLIDSPIVRADEESNNENPEGVTVSDYQDSFTWTFYRIGTIKGTVVIRWYGESDGNYGETPCFERGGR